MCIQRQEEKMQKEKKEEDSVYGSGSNSAQRTSANGLQQSDWTDSSEQDNVDGEDQFVLSKDKTRLLKRQGSTSGFTITVSFSTLFMMVLLVISAVAAVVVYRMAVTAALTVVLTFSNASTVATITGKMYH